MKKLIIVVGSTGSSKSELSKKLAKYFHTDIFVADAFQVYKEINAGINKPLDQDLKEINYHFVNYISIYDEWNVKKFQSEFYKKVLDNINDVLIVEGGSNLYIDSIIRNYNFKPISSNLLINLQIQPNEALWDELYKLDENEAKKIPKQNKRRIIQALKIIYSNNEKKSILDTKNNSPIFDCFLIWKKVDRQTLYKILDERTQKMYQENKWLDEVKNLINHDKNIINLNSFKAIGYPEIYQSVLNNKIPNLEIIKQKVRNYAKRQETWIRNKFKINFVYTNQNDWINLIEQCKKFITK